MAGDTSILSLDEGLERVALLERRIKRVALERDKTSSRSAKLAISAPPSVGQAVPTLRLSPDDMQSEVFATRSQNLENGVKGGGRHVLPAQLPEHARGLTIEIKVQKGLV